MNNGNTVTAKIALALVVPQEEATIPLVSTFSYAKDDPYAVRIAFHVGLDRPVEWNFARELLSEGIDGPQGLGDVRVWPSAPLKASLAATLLNVQLSSPAGRAQFTAPIRMVDDFLRRTYDLVPAGRESTCIDLESGLARLLREVS